MYTEQPEVLTWNNCTELLQIQKEKMVTYVKQK